MFGWITDFQFFQYSSGEVSLEYMYSETCLNDHLNAATTSFHCPETTVPTDSASKETVTGLAYGGHLSTADYGHYAAPLLTDLHATLPRGDRMATMYWPKTWGVA